MNPDTEVIGTPVVVREGACCEPSLTPDGTQLVFRSDVDERLGPSLYGVTMGSDDVTLLYAQGVFPDWTP